MLIFDINVSHILVPKKDHFGTLEHLSDIQRVF